MENKIQRRRWLTHYAPLIVWTVVILGLGSSIGSMNETSRFIRPLLEFFFPDASAETLTFVHGLIRKFAHFAEYAFLAFLALRAFENFKLRYVLSFVLVVAVAASDEAKQSFDPTRTSSPWDLMLDAAGGLTAIALHWLVTPRKRWT